WRSMSGTGWATRATCAWSRVARRARATSATRSMRRSGRPPGR
ncbi:MAG: hypothetical protein AVDCRST_MAG03-772, partial [uncultured Rubrobacteraceae bacterium]